MGEQLGLGIEAPKTERAVPLGDEQKKRGLLPAKKGLEVAVDMGYIEVRGTITHVSWKGPRGGTQRHPVYIIVAAPYYPPITVYDYQADKVRVI